MIERIPVAAGDRSKGRASDSLRSAIASISKVFNTSSRGAIRPGGSPADLGQRVSWPCRAEVKPLAQDAQGRQGCPSCVFDAH